MRNETKLERKRTMKNDERSTITVASFEYGEVRRDEKCNLYCTCWGYRKYRQCWHMTSVKGDPLFKPRLKALDVVGY